MNQELVRDLRARVEDALPGIVELRRTLHASPELGLDTFHTARAIRDAISATSVAVWDPLLGADVIGELACGSSRRVCLRADTDAVPVQEQSALPYRSTNPGVMHACAHDGHAAMLVGAALVLDPLRDRLRVNVRFVFQPGEETLGGGKALVARGACDGCEAAYAIHGWPGLPVGCISTREGPIFAAGSQFAIRVTGTGCHGAMPEEGNSPIPIAARIVDRLQQMHGTVNAEDGSVISVCVLQAGSSSNVIPESAELMGTARYLTPQRGDEVERSIRDAAAKIAGEAGAEVDIDYRRDYDLPVINSPRGHQLARRLAQTWLPEGGWQEAERPSMGVEDFAYYLPDREGAMIRLGLGEQSANLHSPGFDFNDEALSAGIMMFCLLALSYGR